MSELLNVEELFASNVFTVAKMRERLPKKVFQEVKKNTRTKKDGSEYISLYYVLDNKL